MIVCVCEGIGHREIIRRVECGADSVQELGNECGAGKSCGQCVRMLQDLIAGSSEQDDNTSISLLAVCAK